MAEQQQEQQIITEKRCTRCGQFFPLDHYHVKRSAADGIASHCRDCERIRKSAHPERITQSNAQYRATHPEQVKADNDYWNAMKRGPQLSVVQFFMQAVPVIDSSRYQCRIFNLFKTGLPAQHED